MDYITYKSTVWNDCLKLFKDGVDAGVSFCEAGNCEKYLAFSPTRIESAVNSRYLHRGFYCPSPVFDLILSNSRRGKLLLHPSKRSKITHRYFYSGKNEIYIIEYHSSGSITGHEFIVLDGDKKYGFVIDNMGTLCGISVETYCENKLQSYLWSKCYNASSNSAKWEADYVHYETYEYDAAGLIGCNLHFVALTEDAYHTVEDADELVAHEKFLPVYVNDQIVDVQRLGFHGEDFADDTEID